MKRKLISIFLLIAMVISVFPASGMAADASDALVEEQNVALGKTVTGAKAKLVDGIANINGIADWTDFANDKFVEVDLADVYDVAKAYIYKRTDSEGAHPVSIWAYNEKKSSLADIVGGDGLIGTIEASAEKATFDLSSSKTARYIYLTSTDKTYVGIYELEIYAIEPLPTQIIYVSSTGTADASGATASEPTTFAVAKAATKNNTITEVVMLDSMTWASFSDAKGYVKIKGNTSGISLTFSSATLPMYAAVEFSNLILNVQSGTNFYANGKRFKIDENCTTTNRITVYGGGGGAGETYASTNLILLGGNYNNVFGGGMGKITGDTNIIFGGNANKDDSINESSSAYSPTYIFGSSSGGVDGSTNVIMEGNAVARYVCGAYRSTTNTPSATNITIKENAKIMNVYGGVDATSDTAVYPLTIDTVTINIEGGDIESIFGGCYGANLTGNVFINWSGGNIRRRLYTGCYNNYPKSVFNWSFVTDAYVNGTTTLSISGGTRDASNLDSGNNSNTGIFPGSRHSSNFAEEINTVIYQNDCHGTYSGYVKSGDTFGGYADYIVKSGTGGKVLGTNTPGTIYIAPDEEKCGIINNVGYRNENATINTGTTSVTYDYDFKINAVTPTVMDSTVEVSANITANNYLNSATPYTIAAIYDEYGRFIGCNSISTLSSTTSYNFCIASALESGRSYILKIMIWDANRHALINAYQTTLTK